MYFFIIFSILFISHLIAFSVLYTNLNNYYNSSFEHIWSNDSATYSETQVLYNKLLQIKTYMTEHLCLIFIMPILYNLLLMGIFKSIDISDNIGILVMSLVIKIIFCIYILIKNALDKEKTEIEKTFTEVKESDLTKKIQHDLVEHIHNNFQEIYNIVYSIELAISILLIIIMYKMNLD